MYSDSAIITLASNLGFGAFATSPGFALDAGYVGETNGLKFTTFHELVTPDNLYKCMEPMGMDKPNFEAKLNELRVNGARKALAEVLDQNKGYDDDFDYDSIIEAKTPLLSIVIGYEVAIMALELMISTKRTNLESINTDLTESKLNLQINGYKTERGVVVAVGLQAHLNDAIKKATNVIFQNRVTINGDSKW